MTSLDISNGRFDLIDFSEAVLMFDMEAGLSSILRFQVWGALLLLPEKKNLYCAHLSHIEFSDCNFVSMNIYLYEENDGKTEFLRDESGSVIQIQREWGEKAGGEQYLFAAVQHEPYGFCELVVESRGKVEFCYEESRLIDAELYCLSPEKYAWKR